VTNRESDLAKLEVLKELLEESDVVGESAQAIIDRVREMVQDLEESLGEE
jgi:hypothetical protein